MPASKDEISILVLFVLEEEYSALKKILTKEFGQLYYKPSNANASTQLLVDGLLLDLKFAICFLPRKSLVLSYDIPFSSVVYKTEYLLLPDVEEEKLFTFWTHHLFLDKKQLKQRIKRTITLQSLEHSSRTLDYYLSYLLSSLSQLLNNLPAI